MIVFDFKGTRCPALVSLHIAGQAVKPALAWQLQGITLRHLITAREQPADRGMEITAPAPAPCPALQLTDRIQRYKTQRCCR